MRGRRYSLALLAILAWAPPVSMAQRSQSIAQPSARLAQPSEFIYVVRRGWHIDIGFAVTALERPLQSLAAQFPGARYVLFGFGDQHYLLAKNRNGPVLLAALWPGRGMILATAVTSTPQAAFGDEQVIALAVTVSQARNAQAFIWQSLSKRSDPYAESADQGKGAYRGQGADRGQSADRDQGVEDDVDAVRPYGEGPYEGSLYFAATPKYSAFHTCNTWVAEALKAAPLPIHSVGVIFAGQLWGQVRRLGHRRASLPDAPQLQGGFDPF